MKDIDKEFANVLELGKDVIAYKRIFGNASLSGIKYYFAELDGASKPLEKLPVSNIFKKIL